MMIQENFKKKSNQMFLCDGCEWTFNFTALMKGEGGGGWVNDNEPF